MEIESAPELGDQHVYGSADDYWEAEYRSVVGTYYGPGGAGWRDR